MKHIKNTFTEYTGGGFYVDFVTLENGEILGINEECIVLYKSIEDFENGSEHNKTLHILERVKNGNHI